MEYRTQSSWREIQAFLPKEFQLDRDHEPSEEWWQWKGHQIHLDCFRHPKAKIKVILFHGVGTNGRQMSTILGSPLFRRGFETIAIDMPEYGMTKVAPGVLVTYDDWVQAGSALIDAELEKDRRPIVLYGLSAGGMLAYHTAALSKKVKGIVGIKEATGNIERAQWLIREAPKGFSIYSGDDGTAVALMLCGGHGNVSVSANLAPRLMHELCIAAIAGDTKQAMAIQFKLLPLHKNLFVEANPIPVKWAMARMKLCGPTMRLPMTPLTQANEAVLEGALRATGLL